MIFNILFQFAGNPNAMRCHLWWLCFVASLVVIGPYVGHASQPTADETAHDAPVAVAAENTGQAGTDTGSEAANTGNGAADTGHEATNTEATNSSDGDTHTIPDTPGDEGGGHGDGGHDDTGHEEDDHHGNDTDHGNGTHPHHSVHVVAWAFERVRTPLMLCIIIIIAAFLKVGR